jgi:single-stranded DNA-binding protein
MSATLLIHGKLYRDPERKVTKVGKAYASATIRDHQGEGATCWRVPAFGGQAAEDILALRAGDGVAATGAFKAEAYDRDGSARVSLTLFADWVSSARWQKRERPHDRLVEQRQSTVINGIAAQRPFGDEIEP